VTPTTLRETHAFVAPELTGRKRVLEVGCGRGALAQELAAKGHEMTAIDVALADDVRSPGVTFVRADVAGYEPGGVFDAIVAVSALHHISPLDDVTARLARLLAAAGVLVLDDFDVAAPDAATARWNYGVVDLLTAAGRLPESHHGSPEVDPLARWTREHEHGGERLHDGPAMLEALKGAGFAHAQVTRGPYLYRFISGMVHRACDAATAQRVSEYVLATERSAIAAGAIVAVGWRVVARVERNQRNAESSRLR
jgi:SAM-dependent methyltransferase